MRAGGQLNRRVERGWPVRSRIGGWSGRTLRLLIIPHLKMGMNAELVRGCRPSIMSSVAIWVPGFRADEGPGVTKTA